MSALQSDSLQQDGRHETVCGRSVGRLASLVILPLAVVLLVALRGAAPALATWPALTESISQPLASPSSASHQGLGSNVTVPAWASGKSIHFFASPGAGVSFEGLTEPGFKGAAEVNPDLGRRCEEGYCPEPPVLYHEGKGVQHSPSVHVIFWGKNWEKAPGSELRTQLLKLYEGVSGSAWQGILTQYFDTTGRVSSAITVSSYIDTSVAAPSSVNDHALREEVASAVRANGWSREFSSQFVVIPAPGTTYTAYGTFTANTTKGSPTLTSVSSFANVAPGELIAGPGIPDIAEVTAINTAEKTATINEDATTTATGVTLETEGFAHGFCGYHGVDGSGSSYTFVAYPGEEPFKKGCIGFDPKENADHVTTMIASHEYAESATDPQVEPFANAEWYTSNDYELADICASGDDEITSGSLKGSFVQGLWDDHQRECSLSDVEPPQVYAVTEPATSLKPHEATLHGIINPENTETKYYFEYGPTTSYGTKTAEVSAGSGMSNKEAKQTITGLTLEGTYHYRVVATNSTGTTDGEDHTFTLSRWTIQTTPHPSESEASELSSVSCTSSASCTAVGQSVKTESSYNSLAEHWNGTEWAIQTTPQPESASSKLQGVSCASSTACTAVGWYNRTGPNNPFAENWNGTTWTIQTPPAPKAEFSELTSVSCTSSAACTAVGIYGYPETMFAEHWNGSEWTLESVPAPSGAKQSRLYSVSCVSAEACTGVGAYENSKGVYGVLAEHWNGKEWSQQEMPNPTGTTLSYLRGLSCTSGSACTAVGAYESSSVAESPLAERWNGTAWTAQTPPTPAGTLGPSYMLAVSCYSATLCVAGGSDYVTPPGMHQKSVALAEYWNGAEWLVQAPLNPGIGGLNTVAGVACEAATPETCIGVGNYYEERPFSPPTMFAESRIAIEPTVEAKAATSVGETEATLNSAVNPEGYEAKYYFEYGSKKYEFTTAEASAGSGTSELEESKAVSGLVPSETYKVRIVARNGGGEAKAETTFSTTGKPTVETNAATSITETGATLYGTVNPRGIATKYFFEYGTTESYGSKTAEASAGSGTVGVEESKAIKGLTPGVTYHFRIVATNSKGTADGSDQTLYTATKPTVETKSATSIGEAGATLNGSVDPRGAETKYYFEYGTTESYGTKTAEVNAGSGTTNLEENKTVTGLLSGTTYHFRLVAKNSHGTADGGDQVFSTLSKPAVETKAATSVRATGATLNGTVNPEKFETTYHFEYGPTTSYGTSVPVPSANVGSGTSTLEQRETVAGLEVNTTYHYRIVATNSAGTADGLDKTFTTLTVPSWRITSTPNPTGEKKSQLKKISCASPGTCTGVGDYTNSAGTLVTLAEAWNGEEWKEQATPNPTGAKESELDAVSCTAANTCTAVGSFLNSSGVFVPLAERWNGEAWSIQEPPSPTGAKGSGLNGASCTSSSTCTAVGAYENSEGVYTMFAEAWNGTSWSIKETPSPTGSKESQLLDVSCPSSSACVATGEFMNSAGKWRPLAESWNGTAWSAQEPPIPTGATLPWPEGVSCTSSSSCEIVGSYDSSKEGLLALAEGWNGTTWSVQATPKPTGSGLSKLSGGVSCTSSTSCTAVGHYTQIEPTEEGLTLAEHWNGTAWSIQSTLNPTGGSENTLLGVSCTSATECATVGYYDTGKTEESRVTLAEIYG